MSVYTRVEAADVAAFLKDYAVGDLLDLQGIADGIENTNYFVTTSGGRFVLTLFERLGRRELPYYLRLMQHLAQRGIPVPGPQADAAGEILHTLKGKPAALVDRLTGTHPLAPDADVGRGAFEATQRLVLMAERVGGMLIWDDCRNIVTTETDLPEGENDLIEMCVGFDDGEE